MRQGKAPAAIRRSRGFTLFEMVVVIVSIVILYMVAEERLNELPAAAERANYYAVLEQIKTGVNFEMVTKLTAGKRGDIMKMEGANPMDYLIEPPSNYEGELVVVTDAVKRRNAWYFETSTGELVYVVGGSSIDDVTVNLGGYQVKPGQIRLKIQNHYSASDGEAAASEPGRARRGTEPDQENWEAILLTPVNEYTWERTAETPVPLNQ